MSAPLAAAGVRLPWDRLPAHVRHGVEQCLGAPVVEATDQVGGFSPGVAARVRCSDGTRAFVKAVGLELNPDSPGIHRTEARITAALPAAAPAPRLRGTVDDGGWVALIFDQIDGRMPHEPWHHDELDRTRRALCELARVLTPCPIAEVPDAADELRGLTEAYRGLAADPPDDLDPWEARHLDRLAAVSESVLDHVGGDTLVHSDIRSDNVLLTGAGVWFVDWPWAFRGAAWIDSLMLLQNAAFHGHDPEPYLPAHPLLATVPESVVTGFVAGIAGFFAAMSRRPAPPGLPTLREFQRAQHATTLAWVRRRTEWA